MSGPPGIEEACDEIAKLRLELDLAHATRGVLEQKTIALRAQARDFDELSRFWRNCAERALRLWERAQDELEDTRALGRRAARMAITYADLVLAEIGEEEEVLDDIGQAQIWLEQLQDADAPPER